MLFEGIPPDQSPKRERGVVERFDSSDALDRLLTSLRQGYGMASCARLCSDESILRKWSQSPFVSCDVRAASRSERVTPSMLEANPIRQSRAQFARQAVALA